MLQEGATAAKQLTKSWLGSQYLLMLQTEPKVPPQQHPLLQGETLWRRSKRFLSSLLPSCRLDRCKDNTDSTSESSNEVSLDASSKGNGSAYGASEHYFFTPIQVHGRNGLDATQLHKEKQQLGVPSGKQQQGLLRCIGAEKLAVAAAAVGDALDSALKQHALLQDFVDGSLEPHQVLHQKKQLLELQQHVEEALQYGLPELWKFVRLLLQASSSLQDFVDGSLEPHQVLHQKKQLLELEQHVEEALQYGLPELWKFVRLLLQASSRGVEELLRQMPLLLLAAAIMAATAAGASFVRHLASEQPVGKLYAACSSWWRALGACCCVVASLLLLAAAVSADSTNLLKSLLQDPTMLPRYFPLGNRALEEMLLRSMQEHQDSREGRLQQNRAALLPIPKTKELEQLVETLTSRSSPSRALWDSISMLQLHLEGHAASDWVYYPAPSLPGFRISLSTSNESSVSDAVGYQELLFELRKLTGVNWAFRQGDTLQLSASG
ncbi:hypothetical protein, conserved [Eimeria praecox]|uniref:Uncharacterized protein n=1 Tax=Eimeria praecox TaxID=51316 RepID=U6GZK2_9EIME|nr:hypothetical protein, conserved [Eimeria praecox]